MLKTAIHDRHKKLNASFNDYKDWQVPASYGSVEQEVLNTAKHMGIADISSRGKLKLTGKEHLRLLQGMLSNDVMKLSEGEGIYATLLTVKGKVVSDMRVFRGSDYALMDLEPGMNKTIRDHLIKYKLSYRAEIEDISLDNSLFHICGPEACDYLEDVSCLSLKNMDEYDFTEANISDTPCILFRVNRTGGKGFDIMVTNDQAGKLWDFLLEQGRDKGLISVGHDALEVMRIEAGIPLYGVDFDENTIPIEAGLWNALSFEKGCYIGQEVVARIKWRGRVNWHLKGLVTDSGTVPVRNSSVFSGEKKIGRVTSSVFSHTLKRAVALAYIRREFAVHGTEVYIDNERGNIRAEVSDTPFRVSTDN